MTLTDRWNDLKYAPGHIEAIMIEDLVKEVDSLRYEVNVLKEAMKIQSEHNKTLHKLLDSMRDGPTYGPMIDDKEE